MKSIFLFVVLFFNLSLFSQSRSIYTNPKFNEIAISHQKLAIIPFIANVKLRPRQMKKMSEKEFYDLQISEGKAVQSALESYFLKKHSKGKFKVTFQEINRTNAILKKNNINRENIEEYTTEDLAKLLGVDGIISGVLNTSKPMSDGASLALGLLVGFYGSTNSGNCVININDGKTGVLLWKYDKTLSRSLGSDTNTLIAAIMRKSARKFPYKELEN